MGTVSQRYWALSMIIFLTSCGGGGGGSQLTAPDNTPPPDSDGEGFVFPDVPPLAHCEAPVENNGVFRNVTAVLGLCYDTGASDNDITEAEKTAGGLTLSDIDGDGVWDLYVAH